MKKKIDHYLSKYYLENLKSKIRSEVQNAIDKDNYIKPEDAELINKFLKKLQKEIFIQNKE